MFLSHSGAHDLKKEKGAVNSFDGVEQYTGARQEGALDVFAIGDQLLIYFAHTYM